MYGCVSWTVKKAECQRIDAFELWCWRRLLRVLWTARRSNQSILKEINPKCSLEGLMLKLKLQYFGHMMRRANSLKTPWCWERLKASREGVTENEMVGWHHQLNGHEFKQTLGDGEGQGSLACCSPWGCKDTTERLSNSNNLCFYISTYLLTHQNILSTSQKRFNLEIRVLALSWLVAIDIIVVKPDWLADLVD